MQTLRKKSPLKYRNEPARFFGDGVVFKAKLIGILEVGEARGDRMCQEALQDLKIAIRAAGEHKQRITIHVTIEGLRLRDEKSGESLYHHPVHKISFIAQDMTDSRAFGYIFGSPDCGHRFFGIKTDKAASQVVLAMRDLFQCVFELKKKEIELAKQHIQNRITAHEHQQIKSSILDHKKNTSLLNEAAAITRPVSKPEKSPEATANLVDLEQELSSIQRGITQMERITPNDDIPLTITSTKNVLEDDPFGDSFTSSFSSTSPFNILPPPSTNVKRVAISSKQVIDEDPISLGEMSSAPPILQTQPQQVSALDTWLQSSTTTTVPFVDTVLKTDENTSIRSNNNSRSFQEEDDDSNNANLNTSKSELIDAFSDLDPLGKKSYVDKKYFFQELKNPPKKILKDLTSEQDSIFDAHFSPLKRQNEETLSSSRSHDESSQIIDPFEEEDFSKIVIDQLESVTQTTAISQKSIILPDTKINSITEVKSKNEEKSNEFKGFGEELEADLSIYSTATYTDLKRQGSDSSSKNVFSVDSLSKKLPKANLFGQRNVKRDSNGINMRRLQESDSLSEENEPELPPRLPDSEPPPLPPKNQKDSANDYDRNRYNKVSSVSRDSGSRYDYANKLKSYSADSPPIPLPSRKINRADTSKTSKKSNDDEDYLTPSSNNINSIPQLPPPPPTKFRGTRKSETDPKNLDAPTPPVSAKSKTDSSATAIIPDITLSQLLTLGIDDLAQKLNVLPSKLNTMTLVELTTYLSEFIENSKQSNCTVPNKAPPPPPPIPVRPSSETPLDSPVFKVNFDDAVFEAKFDDNFGELHQHKKQNHEDLHVEANSFVANFENFNQPPVSVIPTADRYAVFREIIDQEIQKHQSFEGQHQESIESNNSNSLEEIQEGGSFDFANDQNQYESPQENQFQPSPVPYQTSSKLDNKITEALSGVKDRYAALRELRNIVLVEDLFDKSPKPPLASISDSNLSDEICDDGSSSNQGVFLAAAETVDNNSLENLPTYGVSWTNDEATTESIENPVQDEELQSQQLFEEAKLNKITLKNTLGIASNKDDLEIDEYMNKAISELSLDQRISPNTQNKSPSLRAEDDETLLKPSSSVSVECKISEEKLSSSPLASTLVVKESSTEEMAIEKTNNEILEKEESRERTITPAKPVESSESWAVFDDTHTQPNISEKSQSNVVKADFESGSSDGKHEWKQREKAYHKRWPKTHTSSSSRDVSPWEEGPGNEHRKRHQPPHYHHSSERYSRPQVPSRHKNDSLEGEYFDDYERRPSSSRVKLSKSSVHRSKEILESDNANWYHPPDHSWYRPNEEEDDDERVERMQRPFDRNAYERSTYGPPYDKRDSRSYQGFDRNDRRLYDKRSKYYRPYNRSEYDTYDHYDMPTIRGGKLRKEYDDYEKCFERGSRETRSAREYFYDKDKRSFDSNESFESASRMHRMNSGEIYGSYESGRNDFRDRYVSSQGNIRMSRRNQRSRGAIDDDSDEIYRENSGGGSLQRPKARSKHSNIKLDDDVWSSGGMSTKYWKQRPASASGDRLSAPSESEDERDKRYRRKAKQSRSKDIELRSNYATIRHSQQQFQHQRRDYNDFEDDTNDFVDEQRQGDDNIPRDYYVRKKYSSGSVKTILPTPSSSRTEKNFNEYGGKQLRYSKTEAVESESEDDNFKGENRITKKNFNLKKSASKDIFQDDLKEDYFPTNSNTIVDVKNDENFVKKPLNIRKNEYRFEDHQRKQESINQLSHSSGLNKFSMDGFESDFNSSPKQQQIQSQYEQKNDLHKFTFEESETSPNTSKNGSTQQKLRFNENVSISKFDKNEASTAQQMFEDDFLQSWSPEITGTSGNVQMQSSLKKSGSNFTKQENIKKSDSINIFARKVDEDPFANDDFFNSEEGNKETKDGKEDPFEWENDKNNFANFDDNKNI